jgi:hypothetical protein
MTLIKRTLAWMQEKFSCIPSVKVWRVSYGYDRMEIIKDNLTNWCYFHNPKFFCPSLSKLVNISNQLPPFLHPLPKPRFIQLTVQTSRREQLLAQLQF